MRIAKPESHGFDAARLRRIDAFLQERYIDSGKLPNAQLLIGREEEIVHFTSLGAAREGGSPVDETSLFRIASMTKPVTSIAFMMLVEEGRVAVDTPVHHVLPEFKGLGVYRGGGAGVPFQTASTGEPMRMVDLLRHTSGLTYRFQNRSNVDAAYRAGKIENWHGNLDLDGFVAALGELPLEFTPGEAWNYSVSTDVIGYLVEKISGQPFEQFLQERIFDPLGMTDTGFFVPPDKAHRLAACYAADGKGGFVLQDDPATSSFLSPPKMISGGGGLCSTAADYLTFCRALLNGGALGDVRLLAPKTIALMTNNHLPGGAYVADMSTSMFSETSYAGVGFGLGFSVMMNPVKTMIPGSAGEYGWGGAASTVFWIDPAEQLIAIFMTQLLPSSAYPVRRELRTMIYSAITDSNV